MSTKKIQLSPEGGLFDSVARKTFKKNRSSCISWILASSYCYYVRYTSILSDTVYDKMCKFVLDNYGSLEHPHKHLLTKDMLRAGTAHNLRLDDYPMIVRVTAEKMIEQVSEYDNLEVV